MSIDAAQEDAEAEAGARLGRQALANGTAIAVVHEVVDPQGKRRGEAIERTVGMPRSRRKDQGSQENDGESQRWRRPSWPGDAAQKSSSSAAGHERSSRRSTWSQSPHVASVERFQPYPSPHAHVRPGHDRRYAPSSYAPSSVASSSNGDDPMEHDVFPDASAFTFGRSAYTAGAASAQQLAEHGPECTAFKLARYSAAIFGPRKRSSKQSD